MLKSKIRRVCLGSIFSLCLLSINSAIAQETPNREDSQNYRSQEYRIHIGDVLQISVYKHPELSGRISVRGDGNYILPLATGKKTRTSATDDTFCEQPVVGFTVVNVAAALREKLKPVIADPQVTVTVVDTIMRPGPPSDSPPPQLQDTPSPTRKPSSTNT